MNDRRSVDFSEPPPLDVSAAEFELGSLALSTQAFRLGKYLAAALDDRKRLEAIAKAATAFVDEQGKLASRELLERADFATHEWEDLVGAMEGAGR